MSGPPPPPPLSGAPPVRVFVKSEEDTSLAAQVQKEKELVEAVESLPDDVLHAPKTDAFPKIQCPRCEKMVLQDEYPSHRDAHSSEILEGFLFLGSMQNAHNKKELTVRTNITDILNVAEGVQNVFAGCKIGCMCEGGGLDCNGREESNNDESLFAYHTHRIKDMRGEDIFPMFNQMADLLQSLEDNKRRVLVHCIQGISRSSSIVIAFLMRSRGWSFKKAYEHVHARRAVAKPIDDFTRQLGLYEQELAKTMKLEGYEGKPSLTVEDLYDPDAVQIGSTLRVGDVERE